MDLAFSAAVLCGILCHTQAASMALPAPLSIPPSLSWDGDDGWWSTFYAQVGTPGQTVRLLPGTSASASTTTWVVIPEGCIDVNPTMPDCSSQRGGIFYSNRSSSWSTERLQNGADGAIYSLLTFEENYLGLNGNGSYGYDTISLGLPGSGLPTLEHQVIAGIWSDDYYIGVLGLSPVSLNFTSLDDAQTSMMGTLRNQTLISSLTWAYTAGAHYENPPVFGSLTLGGYDSTRFQPNNVSFAFGADFSRDLLVSLQSVTSDTVGTSPLLASSIDIYRLPIDVCEAFAQQFNLTWNKQGELYLVDDIAHTALLAQNPAFTFTIGQPGVSGGETVDIVLPYAAFDLNLTEPIVGNPTRYFPLKQAQNSTQYTLGRTFLQEAYIIADYDRQKFSVSQALFPSTSVSQNLVAIAAPDDQQEQEPAQANGSSRSRLSTGAVVGIVVGSVVVVVAGLVGWRVLAKRRRRPEEITTPPSKEEVEKLSAAEMDEDYTAIRELDGRYPVKPELQAHDGRWVRHELVATERAHEIGKRDEAVELEAA